jgi:formyl-CoA transferase
MGKSDWIDNAEYKTGGDRRKKQKALLAEMDAIFQTQDYAHWAAAFDREGVWYQKVNNPQEAYDDPQAIATGSFIEVPMSARDIAAGRKAVVQVAAPVDFVGSDPTPRRPVPALGEHTEEVAREFGLDDAHVQQLVAAAKAGATSRL